MDTGYPGLGEIIKKLGREYKVPISGLMNENRLSIYTVPVENKPKRAVEMVGELQPTKFASLESVWETGTGFWAGAWDVLVSLGVGGLTFFLFYTGVGGFDNKIVDGMVNLVAYLAGFFGLITRRIQTGKVQTYIAFVLLGITVFFLWFK